MKRCVVLLVLLLCPWFADADVCKWEPEIMIRPALDDTSQLDGYRALLQLLYGYLHLELETLAPTFNAQYGRLTFDELSEPSMDDLKELLSDLMDRDNGQGAIRYLEDSRQLFFFRSVKASIEKSSYAVDTIVFLGNEPGTEPGHYVTINQRDLADADTAVSNAEQYLSVVLYSLYSKPSEGCNLTQSERQDFENHVKNMLTDMRKKPSLVRFALDMLKPFEAIDE